MQLPTNFAIQIATRTILAASFSACLPKPIPKLFRSKSRGECLLVFCIFFSVYITCDFSRRVLLERLIVNRPHPWGLLITFIELIKNPVFKFWNHEFVHCAPEIEKLFESVARSCMVQKQTPRDVENHD